MLDGPMLRMEPGPNVTPSGAAQNPNAAGAPLSPAIRANDASATAKSRIGRDIRSERTGASAAMAGGTTTESGARSPASTRATIFQVLSVIRRHTLM